MYKRITYVSICSGKSVIAQLDICYITDENTGQVKFRLATNTYPGRILEQFACFSLFRLKKEKYQPICVPL